MQYGMMRAQRTSCLNTDDSWMYEDGHDEIVFSVAKACQLLGIGLCGTEGAYTAEVELLEVRDAQTCTRSGGLYHNCRKLDVIKTCNRFCASRCCSWLQHPCTLQGQPQAAGQGSCAPSALAVHPKSAS